LHNAQKELIKKNGKGFKQYAQDQIDGITELLNKTIEAASKFGPFDEVQLIGGASSLKFMVKAIKNATKMNVRRDFNSIEAIAMGSVIAAMVRDEVSPYVRSEVWKRCTHTIRVKCGNVSQVFCKRGYFYPDHVTLENQTDICTNFTLVADEQDVPKGADPVFWDFGPKEDVVLGGTGPVSAKVYIRSMQISSVEYCRGEVCNESEMQPHVDHREVARAYQFVWKIMERNVARDMRERIEALLPKLTDIKRKLEEGTVEAAYVLTQEQKEIITNSSELVETRGLNNMDTTELREMAGKLKDIAKKIHLI
jgi:hypothetical protein